MAGRKVQTTRNYKLFHIEVGVNRDIDIKKHKPLIESMKKYGFLDCFPIVVMRGKKGQLEVREGQHRLRIAEMLGLPVYFIETTADFDTAIVNSAAKVWTVVDYAKRHVANGLTQYAEGLAFSQEHGIPVGMSFALLAGTVSYGNIRPDFEAGTFKIKDRAYASAVAGTYGQMIALSPHLKHAHFLAACMMVCRVPEFDSNRLVQNAARCRQKLVSFSEKEAFLDLLNEVYNFGRSTHFGLKAAAINAMRDRQPNRVRKSAAHEVNGKHKKPVAANA